MTAAVFRQSIEGLGWGWRTVARILDCDQRLVRRWMSGVYPVPDQVADWVERVLQARDGEAARIPPPGPWKKEPPRHAGPVLAVDLATGQVEDDDNNQ
jgi:hypothetical protein